MQMEKTKATLIHSILIALFSICVSAQAVQTPVSPPSGLVAWWSGDDNSLDSSGNQLGASWLGTPTYVDGKVGRAFDVRNSALSVPHNALISFAPSSRATFEFWAYQKSTTLPFHFFGKRAGTCPSSQINYQVGIDITMPTTPTEQWVHWAAVFDQSGITWYTNSVVFKHFPSATFGNVNAADLRLGTSGICEAFGGYLDEFCIYNRALTLQEIQAIYQAGSAGKEKSQTLPGPIAPPSGLVAWWTGDDRSLDSSTNQLDASWLGAPTYVDGKVGRAFDVQNSALSVPHNSLISFVPGSQATFEFWAYRKSSTLPFHFFGKRAGTCPSVQINYQVGIDVTMPASPTDQWVHWAAVFGPSGITWYANGVVFKNFPGATFGNANAADLRLGTSGVCEPFSGYIDEFCIYNRALTAQEIQAIYLAGTDGKEKIAIGADIYAGITVQAGVGTSCAVQYTESLEEPVQWTTFTNITALPSNPFFVVDRTSNAKIKRFYRVISPAN
jgi:hypothetical protein